MPEDPVQSVMHGEEGGDLAKILWLDRAVAKAAKAAHDEKDWIVYVGQWCR